MTVSGIPEGTKLYKVIGPNGEAIHGGHGAWSLPAKGSDGTWTAGEWMPRITGAIVAFCRGYHLTPKPINFWRAQSRVFEAEWAGDADAHQLDIAESPKVAVREARLLRELDWADFCVWFDGEHRVADGHAIASGSASVEASGSASVEASGSASVEAYDSASVEASGSASVISTRYHSPSATVALADLAAHIDRRGGKLVLRRARASRKKVGA